jgi:uncharacterized protein (DUF1499 family)
VRAIYFFESNNFMVHMHDDDVLNQKNKNITHKKLKMMTRICMKAVVLLMLLSTSCGFCPMNTMSVHSIATTASTRVVPRNRHRVGVLRLVRTTSLLLPDNKVEDCTILINTNIDVKNKKKNHNTCLTREQLLRMFGSSGFLLLSSTLCFKKAADAVTEVVPASITSCIKPPSGSGELANCISTSNVKQVDMYATPWTWSSSLSAEEVIGRLKGVLETDSQLTITENVDNKYFIVNYARNPFTTDEIIFLLNAPDNVITYKISQIEGPENVSDFGQQRKKLEEIRKRTAVLGLMGSEYDSADSQLKQGVLLDSLKPFGASKVVLDSKISY